VSGARARGARAGGVVAAFDAVEGLGRITLDDGDEVSFHATQLADGSRTIEVGRRVVLTVVPWHLGRREATDVAWA
jgi:cold shock CspA family protein